MKFLYEIKVKISNIMFLYFIINHQHLDYRIYINLKPKDLNDFEKFNLSRNNVLILSIRTYLYYNNTLKY